MLREKLHTFVARITAPVFAHTLCFASALKMIETDSMQIPSTSRNL